jgi:hypothetical protein
MVAGEEEREREREREREGGALEETSPTVRWMGCELSAVVVSGTVVKVWLCPLPPWPHPMQLRLHGTAVNLGLTVSA